MSVKTDDFATRFTGMALVLATHFKVKFGKRDVGGRAPVLSDPIGPSSHGGEMSRQTVNLVREGMRTIGVGWVDCAKQQCELRSWEYLEGQHKDRYPNDRLRLDKKSYATFFVDLASFFRERRYDVAIPKWPPAAAEVAPKSMRPSRSRAPRSVAPEADTENKQRALVLGGVLLVVVMVAAVLFFALDLA